MASMEYGKPLQRRFPMAQWPEAVWLYEILLTLGRDASHYTAHGPASCSKLCSRGRMLDYDFRSCAFVGCVYAYNAVYECVN